MKKFFQSWVVSTISGLVELKHALLRCDT